MKQEPSLLSSLCSTFYFLAPFGFHLSFFGTRGRPFAPTGTRDERCSSQGLCVREGAAREVAAPGDVARDGVSQRMEH